MITGDETQEILRCRVKICGITNKKDAIAACDAGADAVGFVFYEKSPRYIDPVQAGNIIKELPPFVTPVGVFVDHDFMDVINVARVTGIHFFQLHGDETPDFCANLGSNVIKAFRVRHKKTITALPNYKVSAYLLDTFEVGLPGGTGKVFKWDIAEEAKKFGRIILSGGLTPENIREAITKVKPYAVDVSSGVETEPGKKDEAKIREFIRKALYENFTR
jgi:phosphoribosylanthranilate isomerase